VAQPEIRFALKVFSKPALKSKKEYVRRPDGKGMEIKTQLDKVINHELRAILRAGNHPNIASTTEIIDTEDSLILVMEFVERGRLSEWNAEKGLFIPAKWAP
jgi:hypothetical protein